MTTSPHDLKARIGIDLAARLPIEDSIRFAAEADFTYVDVRLGDTGNEFSMFDDARTGSVRNAIESRDLRLGLHTLSGVNMAETAPYLDAAVDEYLQRYIDIAGPLGAGWIVLHAGFHFTGDFERRKKRGLDRLAQLGDYAAKRGVLLLLENMNPEPWDAEVKYLAHDIEETKYYFDNLGHENIRWSYTVNHAHLLPVGVEGFYKAFGSERLSEVRLADNKGDKEEHLFPGDGTIDFNAMFDMIEADGFEGHYMLAFADPDAMRRGRDVLVDQYAAR